MNSKDENLYRIALYGRTGSGKSCFLGVLALGKTSQTGATADRLPVTVAKPRALEDDESIDAAKLTAEEKDAASLHQGKEWLDEVVNALCEGKLPRANPPIIHIAPPGADFRISAEQMGKFTVRLVDYSGELINPDLEHDDQSFVRKLKESLIDCDAFLVVAEVSRNGSISSELVRLRQAFHSLHEAKQDFGIPVAIALTKWDRYSDIDFDTSLNEFEKVRKFLNEHSDYRDLAVSISNVLMTAEPTEPFPDQGTMKTETVSSPPDDPSFTTVDFRNWGVSVGACRIFPVSAFGRSELRDGKDYPPSELIPFGLVEPLLWLVDQRDRWDLMQLRKDVARARPWLYLPFAFSKKSIRDPRRRATFMAARLPSKSELQPHLDALRRTLLRGLWISVFGTVLLCSILGALGVDLSVGAWNQLRFGHYHAVISNPSSTADQLVKAAAFFESLKKPAYRGFLIPLDKTKAMQNVEQIDQLLWKRVTETQNVPLQVDLAREYLGIFPNGQYSLEAKEIVARWEAEQKARENQEWLAKAERELRTAGSSSEVEKIVNVLNKGFPHPDYLSDALMSERKQLLSTAAEQLRSLRWQETQNTVRDLMQSGRAIEAAQTILNWRDRDALWQNVAIEVVKELPEHVQRKSAVLHASSDQDYIDLLASIDGALDALRRFEKEWPESGQDTKSVVLQALEAVHGFKSKCLQDWDKWSYENVCNSKTMRACNDYLRGAHTGRMKEVVQEYLAYLNKLDQPLQVTLELSILWDTKYYPDSPGTGDNSVALFINGVQKMSERGVREQRGGSTRIGTVDVSLSNARELLEFRVTIIEIDGFLRFENDDGGQGTGEFSAMALRNGVQIPLRSRTFVDVENRAVIRIIDGWPSEPELPPWPEN